MSFPAPAIAQGIRQLKMVTDWPEGTPGLHSSAVRLAQTIGAATGVKQDMKFHVVRDQQFVCDILILDVDADTVVFDRNINPFSTFHITIGTNVNISRC